MEKELFSLEIIILSDSIRLKKILKSDFEITEKIKLLKKYFTDSKIRDKTIEEINQSFKRAEKILKGINFKNNHLSKLNNYLINRRY